MRDLDRVGEVGRHDDVFVVRGPVAEVVAELHRLRHRVAEPREHAGDVLLVALRPVREVALPGEHLLADVPLDGEGRRAESRRRSSQDRPGRRVRRRRRSRAGPRARRTSSRPPSGSGGTTGSAPPPATSRRRALPRNGRRRRRPRAHSPGRTRPSPDRRRRGSGRAPTRG